MHRYINRCLKSLFPKECTQKFTLKITKNKFSEYAYHGNFVNQHSFWYNNKAIRNESAYKRLKGWRVLRNLKLFFSKNMSFALVIHRKVFKSSVLYCWLLFLWFILIREFKDDDWGKLRIIGSDFGSDMRLMYLFNGFDMSTHLMQLAKSKPCSSFDLFTF